MRRSFRITVLYFIFGTFWIIATDLLSEWIFVHLPDVVTASIIKGLFYVLVTAAFLFSLIFPALKKLIGSDEKIREINVELEKSSIKYKGLYEEYGKKESLLKSLIKSIPDLIFYKDTNLNYIGCNKAFEEFTGKSEDKIIGQTDYELFDKKTAEQFRSTDIKLLKMNKIIKKEERVVYPNGNRVYLETIKTPYYDSDGKLIGLIGISRDISLRKQKEDEIIFLSQHDLLTGLYNRAAFEEKQAELDVESNLPMSVIIGDINGLKLINDSFGHYQGDRLIIEIADILRDCCGDDGVIARVGGDEFAVLIPKAGDDKVKAAVEKIKESCEKRSAADGNILHLTNISLGFSTKKEPQESLTRLMHAAEENMYRHKLFEYKSLHNSILSSIKSTMFEKSYETQEHAERMASMAKKLGQALGLGDNDLEALVLLSALHDIGKISVDNQILTKTGKLTDDEWYEIKKHPEVGYRIAQSSPELIHISEYILDHHERWDGKGYPQGLKENEIPLLSRIISIIDAFDAMTQDRSYRKAMTKDQAVKEILLNAGTQFDPDIASVFIDKVASNACPDK